MDKLKPNKEIVIRENGTKRVVTVPIGESRTQQQFKDQCNVNKIIAKFKATGSVTHVRNASEGVYADLADLPSLMEAEQVVITARNSFAAIPSEIRARFGHDPQNFVDFLKNPKNDEEAIKLGLKVRPAPPKPDPVVEEIKTLGKTLAQKLTPRKKLET
jgi:phage internal scaffolding protein